MLSEVQALGLVGDLGQGVTMTLNAEACPTGGIFMKCVGDAVEVLSSTSEDQGKLNPGGGVSAGL